MNLDKVYGNSNGMETQCAWCINKPAVTEYVGLMAGQEYVLYQVCNKCYNDSPNLVSYDVEKWKAKENG